MSEEIEKTPGNQSEGKESNTLDQEDISKLIDEMKGEENSSEAEDLAEKATDDETKQESDDSEDDKIQDEGSKTLGQDDISKLIDEVQNKEQSLKDENTQPTEDNDDNDKKIGEKTGTQEPDENFREEEQKSEEKIDEKDKREEQDDEDNGSFKGLDSDDEIEIDGEPEKETDKSDRDKTDNKSKENDEDKDKKSKKDVGGEQAIILEEVKKKSKGKRFKLLILCILCVAFIAVLLGAYVFINKSGADNIRAQGPVQPEEIAKPEHKHNEEQTRQQITVYETKAILLSDSIIDKLEEITRVRNKLLIKEGEIADLIRNYKNGISEMEDEILRVKQNNGINSFSVALKNKKIEFGMMTIQERQAYIEKIGLPYGWLNHGIEELLYLKRKIQIDAQISSVISGIDMEKMIQEIDIVIQSYLTGIEKLEIDMKNVKLMSLEMIWKRIIDKEKYAAGNNKKAGEPVGKNKPALTNEEKNNRMIWEKICSGDFKRKNEMTKLSIEAAKCLSKWKHADLFLNGISEISPDVARYLLKWKGSWICLNGVKKLSPEAAKHLFQWKGNWISLNGISEISSGLLRYLPQWQGKQLELMGLKYKGSKSERAGLKSLAKWEKLGGKLYIPVQIRKVIKNIY